MLLPSSTQLTSKASPVLQFKGEAPKKKKRKTAHASSSSGGKGTNEDDQVIDGWVPVSQAALALGPIYLTLPVTSLTSTPVCLALQPTTGKVYAQPILSLTSSSSTTATGASSIQRDLELGREDPDDDLTGATVVDQDPAAQGPSDVNHVWVCTRIPDTDNGVTFRSGSGKFLAVDQLGVVSAEREARGAQEEFTLEDAENGSGAVVIKSSYGKYLSVDVLAGGKLELRADETNEGETERWRPYMQGEYVPKAKKALLERKGIKATVASSGKGHSGLTIIGDVSKAEKESM